MAIGFGEAGGEILKENGHDKEKDMIFIRLVYLAELKDNIENIRLDLEEHTEYRFIKDLKKSDILLNSSILTWNPSLRILSSWSNSNNSSILIKEIW